MFSASLIQITPCFETELKFTIPYFNKILSEFKSVGMSINITDGAELDIIVNWFILKDLKFK